MNKNCTLKKCVFSLIFILGVFSSFACINDVTIDTDNTIDNGDGTCTYDVTITVSHTNDAISINMDAPDGTFNSCEGGSCTNIPADTDGTTVFTASITKICDDEIDVFARGRGASGFGCGADGTRFSGDMGLPAELISFKAVQETRVNQLIWETASEENTLSFMIQRSENGVDGFEAIGRVDASGNSTVLKSYEFIDANPISLAYYRLHIVDIDGSFEYSDVLVVERLKTEIDILEVFPVPVVESEVSIILHSTKEGPVFIDLFDMTGRVIKQDRIILEAGVNRILLDWDSNEGNFYFFTLYNGTERISKKILVSNLD